MGNKIKIYDSGQVYEIDSNLIYTPWFLMGRRSGKTIMAIEVAKQMMEGDTVYKEENENDTLHS